MGEAETLPAILLPEVVIRSHQSPAERTRTGYDLSAMTHVANRPPLEHLTGLIERVTFHNADSGFGGR